MTFGGPSSLPPFLPLSLIPSLIPCSFSLFPFSPLGRAPLQRWIGIVHVGLCTKRTITTETYFFQLSKITELLFKETKILSETKHFKEQSENSKIISETFQRDTEQLSSWGLFLLMIVKVWRWDPVVSSKPWVFITLFLVSFAGSYIPIVWYSKGTFEPLPIHISLRYPTFSWGHVVCILMGMLPNPNWDLQEKLGSHFNLVWAYQQHCLLDQPHYNTSKEQDLLEISRINKGYESKLGVLPRCPLEMKLGNSDKITVVANFILVAKYIQKTMSKLYTRHVLVPLLLPCNFKWV